MLHAVAAVVMIILYGLTKSGLTEVYCIEFIQFNKDITKVSQFK